MTHARVLGDPLTLTVNGAPKKVAAGSSIADLLVSLGVDSRMAVVEHNRVILRDSTAHSQRLLNSGDSIEIVHFVGGG